MTIPRWIIPIGLRFGNVNRRDVILWRLITQILLYRDVILWRLITQILLYRDAII